MCREASWSPNPTEQNHFLFLLIRVLDISIILFVEDENDEPTKHFVSQDLKIEKYIATDEKTHQNYIEVESEIAAV